MLPVPHLLRRSPRLWALGLLAWLALALQGAGVLSAAHPVMRGGMATSVAAAMHPHHPVTKYHAGASDCCGSGANAHCACPAPCTAAMPILPESWMLATLPPAGGPAGGPAAEAPHRFGSPPMRPPLA